jgi:hypothetical protein
MTWKRQENRELRRWIDADVERNHSKCLIRRDICRRKNLIQIEQLLNVRQRHRHSRLQRFRSISTESNNWFERSINNRKNRLRYWELWDDEYCYQKIRRFDQYSAFERCINVWIFHQFDLSDQDDEKRNSLKHRKSTITSKRDYLLHRWISRESLSSRE